MNLAQETINEIMGTIQKVKEEYRVLSKMLSDNDLQTSDILHFIEFDVFASEDGLTTILRLKRLRQARRKIKDELESLQILIDMLENQKLDKIQLRINGKMNKQKERKYTPRTTSANI